MTDTARPELGAAQRALLAQRLRRRAAAPPTATIPVRPPGAPVPLSYAQERLWFLEQYQPGTTLNTVPVVVRVAGPLSADAVRDRLVALTARHEALRSRFVTTEDGRPELVIGAAGGAPVDFTADTADRLEVAMAAVDADLERPFDLERAPLLRVRLIRLGPADHVLLLAAHHTVIDGWSVDLVLRALLDPSPAAAAALPVDYGDYALWQRSRDDAGDVAYWRGRLAALPALDVPTDRPRPAQQRHDGAAVPVAVDAELTAALRGLARQQRATLYMTLLAAYAVLLGRCGGQSDFGIASPVAGRGAPELDGVVGMFVNTVVLRADLAGAPSFTELLGRVRDAALDAFAHAELPFDRLVTELEVVRDVSRSPLAQTTFALQNFTSGPRDPRLTYLAPTVRTARYELGLYLFETDDGLVGHFVHNTALFGETGVRRFRDRFVMLLRAVVAHPTAPVPALSLLSDRERAEALALAVGPALPPAPAAGLLHDVVATQAARVPDATAVVDADRSLTYAALDGLATEIATVLRAHGAAPDRPVALLLDSSALSAAAIVGVLRSGSPYLPLDPLQPADRLAFMLDDAEVRLTLTAAGREASLPVVATEVVEVGRTGLVLVRTGPPVPPASVAVTPEHLAYVIYTSGTTGRPKGVAVAHRQAMTYVAGVAERLDPRSGARFTLLQSLSFDFGLTVFHLALRTGGTLRLADPRTPVEQLAPLLAASDYVKITPSHLDSLLLAVAPAQVLPRRMLVLGGEATSWSRAAELARHTAVVNHYGPTEATVGVCTHRVDPGAAPPAATVPIGRPLPGARVYLLDEQLRPTPPGMVGEIYLGGDRLARGYVRRPDLTAAAFVPDPYAEQPGSRMYRTGDLGRVLPDGDLVFLGRRDHQVKIRGYRVELSEIEATLLQLPGVRQAVVELRSERLVAYLVGDAAPVPALRAALAALLPEYMVPARFVRLDALPLKAHGKVDRARLPEPGDQVETDAQFVAPAGDLEERIAAVWAAVLGLTRVGVEDDFFALGGHSLLAAQVVARLRREVPPDTTPVTLLDLFKHRTVRALAAVLSGPVAAGPARLLHRLTPQRPVRCSVVCLPYGGGSAVIYQPLADALPADTALWSVAVPGHELGEDSRPLDDVAADCVREVLERVPGPVVLYGHCGLGVLLAVETARGLEAAGRRVEAVYLGGVFPFARPRGLLGRLAELGDTLRSDQMRVNALQAAGLDVDEIDPEQLRLMVTNRRLGTKEAERYFGRLTPGPGHVPELLAAPVIAVVGERDPATEFYQERFREWRQLSPQVACAVLEEAGHFYLKYRAAELAEILTVHQALAEGAADRWPRTATCSWWLQTDTPPARPETPGPSSGPSSAPTERSTAGAVAGPPPSMRRFGVVAAAQLVSIVGSALTEFAVPIWIYTTTGSLVSFALLAVIALLPGMLVAPLAGVLVDRHDRRRAMLWGGAAAGAVELAFGVLLWTGTLRIGAVFALLALLSVALTFQRLAYQSSIAQLVPKRFLGHANGIVAATTGAAQLIVPLVAVGLIATIGIEGILVVDVVSYVVATAVVALVRFPAAMAWRRRESMLAELRGGWRHTWGNPAFRAMLSYFAVLNLFVSPLFLMLTPLVLGFATLADVGRVAFAGGVGVLAGGLVMAAWGGPRRRRMLGLLVATLVLGGCCLVTGLGPDLGLVTVGSFGMSMSLTVLNGIYATIIQVKVPQRFHGRVISLNTLVAWSTLPIGFGLVAPYGTALLGGRIGLMYLICAAGIVAVVGVALRIPTLRRFDAEMPDAVPDDALGYDAVQERLRLERR